MADYAEWLDLQDEGWLRRKNREADDSFRSTGITFNVYGENEAEERLIPFDMVPRIITAGRVAQTYARDRATRASAQQLPL